MAVPEHRHSVFELREAEAKTTTPASDSPALGEGGVAQLKSGQSLRSTSALGRKTNDMQKT